MASKPLAALAIVFALLAVPVAPSRAQAGGGHRSHTRWRQLAAQQSQPQLAGYEL